MLDSLRSHKKLLPPKRFVVVPENHPFLTIERTSALARSRAARSHACDHADVSRAHAHAEPRHWQRQEREKRLKTAENRRIEGWPKTAAPTGPESRRLRRNGRFGRESATIGRNANRAIPGPSKSKTPHSTWTSEHYYTCSLSACESHAPRRSSAPMATGCNMAEKHERSLRLLTRSTSPSPCAFAKDSGMDRRP